MKQLIEHIPVETLAEAKPTAFEWTHRRVVLVASISLVVGFLIGWSI